ncbi:MAG: hypothetical protein ABIW79_05250 [Gemmatimonas sp.]
MRYLPISALLTVTPGVVVSAAIVAVVLAATWLPTRKVVRMTIRDALSRE